jgi:NAD(P)-dependent dehydrogenase (short-subunit alcohol dehydrogenase family)
MQGGRASTTRRPKAAVIQATRCVAIELADYRVRVNSISPGPILTGIFGKEAGMSHAEADRSAETLERVFESRLNTWQPMRRAGRTADVASLAAWLASDASAFITGQDIVVDGGISAGRPASVSIADNIAIADAFAGVGRQ